MESNVHELWNRDKRQPPKPYGAYLVSGFRYVGPSGEIGWHTTSYAHNGPIHEYWAINSKFYLFQIHIFNPHMNGMNSVVIGSDEIAVDLEERTALVEAIEDWERMSTQPAIQE